MAATTATASRIHGHTGVEDAVGAGEVVAVGTAVGDPGELVWGAGDVVVVVVEVEVDVGVEVFVAVLVVEVFVGALVVAVSVGVDVEVRVGASLVGGLVVRVEIGVRDGSVGRLSEREALGRFEPPPHDVIRTTATARSAIEEGLVLLANLLHLLELRGQRVSARIDLEEMQRFTEPTVLHARSWVARQIFDGKGRYAPPAETAEENT
jgi:hypothetical protein